MFARKSGIRLWTLLTRRVVAGEVAMPVVTAVSGNQSWGLGGASCGSRGSRRDAGAGVLDRGGGGVFFLFGLWVTWCPCAGGHGSPSVQAI